MTDLHTLQKPPTRTSPTVERSNERLRRGDLWLLFSLAHIGRWLVGARIALGLTQQELAERLCVSAA